MFYIPYLPINTFRQIPNVFTFIWVYLTYYHVLYVHCTYVHFSFFSFFYLIYDYAIQFLAFIRRYSLYELIHVTNIRNEPHLNGSIHFHSMSVLYHIFAGAYKQNMIIKKKKKCFLQSMECKKYAKHLMKLEF